MKVKKYRVSGIDESEGAFYGGVFTMYCKNIRGVMKCIRILFKAGCGYITVALIREVE